MAKPFSRQPPTPAASGGVTTAGGIYRSDDGGNTWTRLSGTGGLPNAGVTDLVINPDNPNQLYAAVPGMLHGTTSSAGIYELAVTATGETTTDITGTGTLLSDIQNAKNVRLSISPASPNPIWVATFASDITGLFRGVTTSGNVTWSAVGPGGLPPEVYATDDIHLRWRPTRTTPISFTWAGPHLRLRMLPSCGAIRSGTPTPASRT